MAETEREVAVARKLKAMRRNVRGLQRALDREREHNRALTQEVINQRHRANDATERLRLRPYRPSLWQRLFGGSNG